MPALPCPALPGPARPCPALPCPALPCSALPCPALPSAISRAGGKFHLAAGSQGLLVPADAFAATYIHSVQGYA